MNKKVILSILLFLALLVGGIFAYINKDIFLGSPISNIDISDENTVFSFYADQSLDNGTTTQTSSFTLESKVGLSDKEIRSIVNFEPEIEYEVKKKKNILGSLIPSAVAQNGEEKTDNFSYTIEPTSKLEKGQLYVVQLDEDSELVNRDYSWAFAVEADFQVIKTLPRHKGTYVPLDSVIEIEFNEDIDESIQNHVRVTPDLNYEIEIVDGEKLVIKHGGLEEATIYEVIINSSLFKEKDSSYAGDFVFTFETEASDIARKDINIWEDYMSFLPSKEMLINIGYSDVTNEELKESFTTKIYQYENTEDFMDEYIDSKNWNWYWTSIYKNNFENKVKIEKATEIMEVEPEIVERDFRKLLYVPNKFEEGVYVMELKNNESGSKSYVWFQVSPIAYYYTYTSDSGLIWLYDFEQKQFLDGAKVSLISSKQVENLGKTNEKGLLKYETPKYLKDKEEGEGDGLPSSFKVEVGGKEYLSLVKDNYWFDFYYPSADRYWNYLSTDRYVYKPTDNIKFWGVVKGREDDLKNDKITVELSGGGYYYSNFFGTNESIASATSIVSNFDTITGEMSFSGINPGFYTVTAKKDDTIVTTANIQIIDFEKPAYTITAVPRKEAVYSGDLLKVDLEAKFFDGTPMPNLEIGYEDYVGNTGYDNFITLDSNGKATLEIVADGGDSEFSYGPSSSQIYFRSSQAEQAEINTKTEVLVFDNDINVQVENNVDLSTDEKYVVDVKVNKIDINATSADSRGYFRSEYISDPVAGKDMNFEIIGSYTEEIADGFYYDPVSKTSKEKFRYEYRENSLKSFAGQTDGDGNYQFEFVPTEEQADLYTSYRVITSMKDQSGRNYKTRDYMGSRRYDFFRGDRPVSLDIVTKNEGSELKIGDKFELELDVPENSDLVENEYLYYGYKNKIEESEVSSQVKLEKEFKKSQIPGFAYQAVALTEDGFKGTNRVIASFDEEERRLDIEMSTDKDKYRPGEKVDIEVLVKDKKGKAVDAEVNLSSVDEALFHILPFEFEKDILNTLYIDNIDSPVSGSNRLETALMSEGAEKGGCFLAGTQILMSNGSYKAIEDVMVGDQVLSFSKEGSEKKEIVTVQGVHNYGVNGYLIINNQLKVTPEHEIYLNGEWNYAGNAKVKDYLIDKDGKVVEIESIELVRDNGVRVYNLNVNKTHTYFADDFYVHNAEKGGSERSEFKDVTLYDSFETGSDGKFTTEFELPDNLTSWRISAKAFESNEIKAGQSNIKVPVSLPLFVNTTISSQYLEGDNPTFEVRAYGEKVDYSSPIEYSLKIEALGIDEKITEEEGFAEFSVGKLPLGNFEIKLGAKQGDLEDILVQKFEVVKSYGAAIRYEDVMVSDNSKDLSFDVATQGMVDLEIAPAGKGKYLPQLQNGLRVVRGRLDHLIIQNKAAEIISEKYGLNKYSPADFNMLDYYTTEDGLALFSYDSADLELTALASDALPNEVIKAKNALYFEAQMENDKSDIERAAVSLYGLASLDQNVMKQVKSVLNSDENTQKSYIFAALALEKMGAKEEARKVYLSSVRPEIKQKGEKLTHKDSALDPLVALLAVRSSYNSEAEKMAEKVNLFDSKGDVYGIASVMTIGELITEKTNLETRIVLSYGEEEREIELDNGYSRSISLTAEQAKNMSVKSVEGKVSLVMSYVTEGDKKNTSKNLTVKKKYFVNGEETNNFSEGDLVKVVLDLNNSSYDEDDSINYLITDYLPSGMKPVLNNLNGRFNIERDLCTSGWGSKSIGNTISFDRYSWIFRPESSCKDSEIVYYARVVSKGEYKAQAAQIEVYGNQENVARGDDITVYIK